MSVSKPSASKRTKRPRGRQLPTPARVAKAPVSPAGMALPHERDQATHATAAVPDPMIVQAKKDLDEGQVDTDMRVTPGLDAERRERLVPGEGGKPPSTRR